MTDTAIRPPWSMPCEVIARTDDPKFADQSDAWHALRRTGIGGSDVLALMGESTYQSPYNVWCKKVGVQLPDDETEAAALGKHFERPVAELFAKRERAVVVYWPVVLRSKEFPFMLANLDFLICDPNVSDYPRGVVSVHLSNEPPLGVTGILEVKTTGLATRGFAEAWADGAVPTGYGLQGRHYHVVTGIDRVVFAALVGGEGLVIRQRLFMDPRVDAELIAAEEEFWRRVVDNDPPPTDGSESTFEALHAQYPTHVPESTVELSETEAAAFERWQTAKEQIAALEEIVAAERAILEKAIGPNEAATFQGRKLYTFKQTRNTMRFDEAAFKADHPDIHAQYETERPGYRRLNPTKTTTPKEKP